MHNKRCGQKSKKIKNLIGRIVKTRWNVTFQISNDFKIEIQISLFRNRKQVICPIVGLFRNPSHRQIYGILPLCCSYYREYIHGVGRGGSWRIRYCEGLSHLKQRPLFVSKSFPTAMFVLIWWWEKSVISITIIT